MDRKSFKEQVSRLETHFGPMPKGTFKAYLDELQAVPDDSFPSVVGVVIKTFKTRFGVTWPTVADIWEAYKVVQADTPRDTRTLSEYETSLKNGKRVLSLIYKLPDDERRKYEDIAKKRINGLDAMGFFTAHGHKVALMRSSRERMRTGTMVAAYAEDHGIDLEKPWEGVSE